MLNIGGGELLVILTLALIVLGPDKLPEVAKQFGKLAKTVRSISNGFQDEMKRAMEDPVEAMTGDREPKRTSTSQEPAPRPTPAEPASEADDDAGDLGDLGDLGEQPSEADVGSGTNNPGVSTAAAAGMYAVTNPTADDAAVTETATEDTASTETTTPDPSPSNAAPDRPLRREPPRRPGAGTLPPDLAKAAEPPSAVDPDEPFSPPVL